MADPAALILSTKEPADDDVPEIHSIPCKIEHTGPAKVSAYLQRERQDKENEKSTFRGRFLDGSLTQIPSGYKLYVLKERSNNAVRRIYDVDRSTDRFMLWEYDRIPSASNPLPRAINFLKIAEDLARDD